MKKDENKQINSKIGGQAVIEGVMMRGSNSLSICVRDADGNLRTTARRPKKPSAFSTAMRKIPVLRGIWAFGGSLSQGVPTLMDSAEVYGEEEPTKFEKWLAEKFKIDLMDIVMAIAVVLGVGLAVGLFFILPSLVSGWISDYFGMTATGRSAVEGGARLVIFVGYIVSTALVSDVKRVYMYHGAEHKTINCFEKGLDLTVENVRDCSTYHNRCGTSFMFFVILLSIVVSSVIQVENEFYRILTRLAFLPLLAGLAYELIVFLANHDSWILYPLRVPGMLMQKITTKVPDDGMIEVAITAFKECQKYDADETLAPYDNLTFKYVKDLKSKYIPRLEKIGALECELYWMLCHILKTSRGELTDELKVTKKDCEKLEKIMVAREKHKPLDYILGVSNFYGRDFVVNEAVLIPRPETELLCETVASEVGDNEKTVLDIGTGSGVIAVTVAKMSSAKITASDISNSAIAVAKGNAEKNEAEVEFILSDVFENIQGKFDIIVSNPPYIAESEKKTLTKEVLSEPHTALFAGDGGLAIYKKIIEGAKDHLTENGKLYFEIGYTQGKAICEILEQHGFKGEILKDYSGNDRIVIGEINV
ncbi:MAG: peptide chain release factor N(5)-glutamine methyltransferase [Bacillota bacterium]